jgi:hypothetical protein
MWNKITSFFVKEGSSEEHYTTLQFENFFQMISQKYLLLNRFFTLIPETTSIFIHHVRFLHKIGVYVLQLLLI